MFVVTSVIHFPQARLMQYLLQICPWMQQWNSWNVLSRNLGPLNRMVFKLEVIRLVCYKHFCDFVYIVHFNNFKYWYNVLLLFPATAILFWFCGIWICYFNAKCTWGIDMPYISLFGFLIWFCFLFVQSFEFLDDDDMMLPFVQQLFIWRCDTLHMTKLFFFLKFLWHSAIF